MDILADKQEDIINLSLQHFTKFKNGIIKLPNSNNKIVSLLIANRLYCNKIFIGVPTHSSVNQWYNLALMIFPNYKISVYHNMENYIHGDDNIIIGTYASYKTFSKYNFDIFIHDEMIYLTNTQSNMIKIPNNHRHKLSFHTQYKIITDENDIIVDDIPL